MSGNQTTVALLPCPFCGSSNVIMDRFAAAGGWGASCEEPTCQAIGPSENDTEEAAIAAWNGAKR